MSESTLTTERLSVDSIDTKPQSFDWSAHPMDDFVGRDYEGVTWKFWEYAEPEDDDVAECNDCGEEITFTENGWRHSQTLGTTVFVIPIAGEEDEDPEDPPTEDDYDHYPEPDDDYNRERGPMMSYWYPVRISDPARAAKKLTHLPVCVVEVDGETGLALTGGGMDLSWEICEAFIVVGAYPPFHLAAHLPRMADRWTDNKARTLAVCRDTCRMMQMWVTSALNVLRETEEWYAGREGAL